MFTDLNSLPLSTLAKAQQSLSRKSSSASSHDQSKEEKLALMKSKLAQMQRNKGKTVAVPDADSHGFKLRTQESDEESDSGPETTSSTKRGSKHAYVEPSLLSAHVTADYRLVRL